LRGKYRGELSNLEHTFHKLGTISVPLRGKYRGEYGEDLRVSLEPTAVVSVPLRGKYRGESYRLGNYILCGFQGSFFTVHLTFVYKRTQKQVGNLKLF